MQPQSQKKFYWPHERPEPPQENLVHKLPPSLGELSTKPLNRFRARYCAATRGLTLWRILGRRVNIKQMHFMKLANGTATVPLASKIEFPESMAALGYRTPRQVVCDQSTSASIYKRKLQETFGDQWDTISYLVKPTEGYKGKGVKRFIATQDKSHIKALFNYVEHNSKSLLIQEYIELKREGRVIILIDGQDTLWRIYFESIRPQVSGDGKSSVEKLLTESIEIPKDRKKLILKSQASKLKIIPALGEVVMLAESGNTCQEAWQVAVDAERLASLDQLMSGVIADFTTKYPSMSFVVLDLGFTDPVEINKKTTVFFEFQMPAGLEGPFGRFGSDKTFLKGLGANSELFWPWLRFYRNVIKTTRKNMFETIAQGKKW